MFSTASRTRMGSTVEQGMTRYTERMTGIPFTASQAPTISTGALVRTRAFMVGTQAI